MIRISKSGTNSDLQQLMNWMEIKQCRVHGEYSDYCEYADAIEYDNRAGFNDQIQSQNFSDPTRLKYSVGLVGLDMEQGHLGIMETTKNLQNCLRG